MRENAMSLSLDIATLFFALCGSTVVAGRLLARFIRIADRRIVLQPVKVRRNRE
jgi:hypothetical protein